MTQQSASPLVFRHERAIQFPIGAPRNFGFDRVECLSGNVGYLELRAFRRIELAGPTVIAAMEQLSPTDALIIDLRRNRGGARSTAALLSSFLFDTEPGYLNDTCWGSGHRPLPCGTTHPMVGARYVGKDVYILTSSCTSGIAAAFVRNLQWLGRATVVGERTGGALTAWDGSCRANEGLGIGAAGRTEADAPVGDRPGGVAPDVAVAAKLALTTAHLVALQRLSAVRAGHQGRAC